MKKIALFFILSFSIISIYPLKSWAQIPTRLRVIEASNVGALVDPSLKDLYSQLGSIFKYTSYRLLRDERLHLLPNQTNTLLILPGRYIEITPIRVQANTTELRVKIKREQAVMLDTQVRLPPGRTVLIGGPKHGEGVLILAFSSML